MSNIIITFAVAVASGVILGNVIVWLLTRADHKKELDDQLRFTAIHGRNRD